MPVCGSTAPPGQLGPPLFDGITSVPSGPSAWLTMAGVYNGPSLYLDTSLTASALSSGVKSIRSSIDTPCRSNAGGFVGNGCVGLVFSKGTSDCGTGRSSIGQSGCPVTRSKRKTHDCLVGWATALTTLPFIVRSSRMGAHGMSQSQMP